MSREKDIVVYGSFNDVYTVFLEKGVAEYYAEIHRCHKEGITFGKLHKRYPWLLNFIVEWMRGFIDLSDLPDAEEHDCDSYFDLLFEQFFEADSLNKKLWGLDIYGFRRFYEDEYERFERLPIKSDIFNENYNLLEILDYQPKMTWAPEEIINRFGETGYSFLGDKILDFNIEDTEAIAEAFEQIGFKCVQDDLLVAKAYGVA